MKLRRLGMVYVASVPIFAWLASSHAAVGEFGAAISAAEEGLRIVETTQSDGSLVECASGLGFVCLGNGDVDRAIPVLERALERCQATIPVFAPLISSQLGYCYALAGRVSEGLQLLERAAAQSDVLGLIGGRSLFLTWLSEANELVGRLEDAAQLGHQALNLAQGNKESAHEAYALRILGENASRAGASDETVANYYFRALQLAGALRMRPLIAQCHFGLGKLYRRTGKRDEAQEHLRTATTMYREMGMTYWLEQAETEMRERS